MLAALIATVLALPPSPLAAGPPPVPLPAAAPPPLPSPAAAPPPEHVPPLSEQARARLSRRVVAPPPSPPYTATPAGRREEGRGWLLQQKLRSHLREQRDVLHGSDVAATRAALSDVALMALESTLTSGALGRSSLLSAVHPVAFRKACVTARDGGSVVQAIAGVLASADARSDDETTALALQSLEALATDDPTTDVDNDHALAICVTGVAAPIVRLLDSPTPLLHEHAAATAAAIAENKQCMRMLLAGGAVGPLLALTSHGSDGARSHALSCLRMMCVDRDGRDAVAAAAQRTTTLAGLKAFGPAGLRGVAAEVEQLLESTLSVAVDGRAHARMARDARVGLSKLRHSRIVQQAERRGA